MSETKVLFSSESVSAGHPDKLADQVSDAILDEVLRQDPYGRVACECLFTANYCCIAGEITAFARIDARAIAQEVLRQAGYDDASKGFDYRKARYEVLLHGQSPEIARKVDGGGAGDQGLVFGYACRETDELLPLSLVLSHRLLHQLDRLRLLPDYSWLRPDAKSQVSISEPGTSRASVHAVVLSAQHHPDVPQQLLHDVLLREVISPVILPYTHGKAQPKILINPGGPFSIGGPHGDTGLTGRKIIVDTYGGAAPHGGGAFSGKDPSKVDRSAAYMARYVARHFVETGIARQCLVQIAYAIGQAEPVSVLVDPQGTSTLSAQHLSELALKYFDLRPEAIISKLGLRRPIYRATAVFGHFGRPEFPWEQTDPAIAEALVRDASAIVERYRVAPRPYDKHIGQWRAEISAYTDEELVVSHNALRLSGAASPGLQAQLKALADELARRPIRAEAVMEKDESGRVLTYCYTDRLRLATRDGMKILERV